MAKNSSAKTDKIKISKKQVKLTITIVAVVAIVLIVGYFAYTNFQSYSKDSKNNAYKKDLFNTIICQYECPLSMQQYNNVTQKLPDLTCVKGCSDPFRAKNYTSDKFDTKLLLADGFIGNMTSIIDGCKSQAMNTTSMKFNIDQATACSLENLKPLKEQYPYLN